MGQIIDLQIEYMHDTLAAMLSPARLEVEVSLVKTADLSPGAETTLRREFSSGQECHDGSP